MWRATTTVPELQEVRHPDFAGLLLQPDPIGSARVAQNCDLFKMGQLALLVGGLLLLAADTVARTILSPVILPVGIMTAFLGGPFFLYLFLRRKKEFW